MEKLLHTKQDGSFDIAVAGSRKATLWQNKQMRWSEFLTKVSTTIRTPESYHEYLSMPKAKQDNIKDIGGFVGGFITNGSRKAKNVAHRSLISLDIDFAQDMGIWEDYCLLYGNAAAIYSTHKHSPSKPRLRLIIPLKRPVDTVAYEFIARIIANDLNIDSFDATTFQPERLMYWPSTAKDGDYLFQYQDGSWLCPDSIIRAYPRWRDISSWPQSSKSDKIIKRQLAKQGDPLQKKGLIGAFCRSYDIHDAIETFLDDVYEPCDRGRYTYKDGSSFAGLITYDDKYAYSHHSTDPASMQLCNAFDLVRIHKYSELDTDTEPNTPSNRKPSYLAMLELAGGDAKVKKQLGLECLSKAGNDFSDNNQQETDWLSDLEVDNKGRITSTSKNIELILEHDNNFKEAFAKNSFENREIVLKDLPWRKLDRGMDCLKDIDDAGLRVYLEKTYNINGVLKIRDALDIVIEKRTFHPVRDYLQTLKWDGQKRIDTLLIDYLGAKDSLYTRAVTRKILTAAIARIYQPGIKFDYVLVMVGRQGIGKSTFIKKLGRQWYSDSLTTVQGKEAFEQIQGIWLMEIGELAGLRKAEMESIKHFISKQEDRYRVAYGRKLENFPRQCVFFGTTNDDDFLRDPTGNRRFWPVEVGINRNTKDLFKDVSDNEIDQIWAEAIHSYKQGESLHLGKELEAIARDVQQEHCLSDERAGIIERYLDTPVPDNWDDMDLYARRNYLLDEKGQTGTIKRQKVCIAEIWCELFGKQQSEMNKYNTKDINIIMKGIRGWKKSQYGKSRFKLYGQQRCYARESVE